jgi:HJR/Mrr/RecB family endonuclease
MPDDFHAAFALEPVGLSQPILHVAAQVGKELISRLYRDGDSLRVIDRRKFEEVVAELFSGFGYEVELTQRTRDGGKDIIAVKRAEVAVRYLIECKRPDPGTPVRVSAVRVLFGVKASDGATKAILATTTYLSPDARAFIEKHRWELEAREYEAVRGWLAQYLSGSGG